MQYAFLHIASQVNWCNFGATQRPDNGEKFAGVHFERDIVYRRHLIQPIVGTAEYFADIPKG